MKIILIIFIFISVIEAKDYKYLELISNSKIQIYTKSRKLHSNAAIYGRFYSSKFLHENLNNGVYGIKCGKTNHLYKTVDECYMYVTNKDTRFTELKTNMTDKLYLSKTQTKYVKSFNYNTHMIECTYSKKHDIMQKCEVKQYRN